MREAGIRRIAFLCTKAGAPPHFGVSIEERRFPVNLQG